MKYSTHNTYLNEDGIEVPSATTILGMVNKPSLQPWANFMGFKRIKVADVLEKSSTIGSEVHELIECLILNKKYEKKKSVWYTDETLVEYIDPFITWFNDQTFEPVFVEESMSCDRYGGTIDYYGMWNGKHTILDWKTSKNYHMGMFLQLGAYCKMLEEKGHTVEQVAIVRVNPGKLYVKLMERSDLQHYIDTFITIVEFFHAYYDLAERDGWKGAVTKG